MPKKGCNKGDLIAEIADKTGCSVKRATYMVDVVLAAISDGIIRHSVVSITGFGRFEKYKTPVTLKRNFKYDDDPYNEPRLKLSGGNYHVKFEYTGVDADRLRDDEETDNEEELDEDIVEDEEEDDE